MMELEQSMRSIRDNDEQAFEELELSLYNLEEQCGSKMDDEQLKRRQ